MQQSGTACILRLTWILGVCLCVMAQGPAWAADRDMALRGIEERLEQLEQSRAQERGETGNMVFFRGGWTWARRDRSNEVFTDVFGLTGENNGDDGWYAGAGLDLVLSKDVWGMLPGTWVMGEIGVEFKRFDSKRVAQAVPSTCATAGVPGCPVNLHERVEITMLTVDVSPKIKLLESSNLRPWIIPVGLDFNVISPPSNDTTYLDLGLQFGVGVDYRLWQAFHLGVDARYHVGFKQTNVTTDFGTLGAYVGIAF
jgi:hypothetical protein